MQYSTYLPSSLRTNSGAVAFVEQQLSSVLSLYFLNFLEQVKRYDLQDAECPRPSVLRYWAHMVHFQSRVGNILSMVVSLTVNGVPSDICHWGHHCFCVYRFGFTPLSLLHLALLLRFVTAAALLVVASFVSAVIVIIIAVLMQVTITFAVGSLLAGGRSVSSIF